MDQPLPPNEHQEIAQLARNALHVLQLAERGLVPLNALRRHINPRVLEAFGPIKPPPPGIKLAQPRVGGVQVELVHPHLARVAAVARRPGGAPSGYVIEARRDGHGRPWEISELTRVEDRVLVGPESVAPADRRTRQLPSDLTGLLNATRWARDDAARHLADVENRLRQAEVAADNAAPRRPHARPPREVIDLRRGAEQWRLKLRQVDEELRELEDVRALRAARDTIMSGDPVTSPHRDALEEVLGRIPDDVDARNSWRQAAKPVLAYVERWSAHDLLADMPQPDANPDLSGERELAYRAARQAVHHRTSQSNTPSCPTTDQEPAGERALEGH